MNVSLQLWHGDCVERLAQMEEGGVGAIICDPPYGLEFMGKGWDRLGFPDLKVKDTRMINDPEAVMGFQDGAGGNAFSRSRVRFGQAKNSVGRVGQAQQAWHEQWLREAFRVLDSGGIIKAFGGTRTFHRMTKAMLNVGFVDARLEAWVYGSGFPKSTNISKMLDKQAGAEREVVGYKRGVGGENMNDIVHGREVRQTTDEGGKGVGAYGTGAKQVAVDVPITIPMTELAKLWEGYGTALKPAWEPVVCARKPEA